VTRWYVASAVLGPPRQSWRELSAGSIPARHISGQRETIRKSLLALGRVLDFASVRPNPVRDRVHVRLPREQRAEINPPTAAQLEAVVRVLPSRYRLPALVLDGTGMRVGELERLTWGDVDEPRGRWRVSAGTSKTDRARWVQVPPDLFIAVCEIVPREDRTPERRVFQGFGADRFRTALTRPCTAAGVPHFSPHDLRHRWNSLLHLARVPWARIGEHVGQRSLRVRADTYSHVLADDTSWTTSSSSGGSYLAGASVRDCHSIRGRSPRDPWLLVASDARPVFVPERRLLLAVDVGEAVLAGQGGRREDAARLREHVRVGG
jgi:integrase